MANSTKQVYLIHGWAANRHVFADLVPRLPSDWQVQSLDLLGHGEATFSGDFQIDEAVNQLAEQIADDSIVVGWSLGGLLALLLAHRFPNKVRALCLTASFAKLKAENDYPEGLNQVALGKMVNLFAQDYHKYMKQFLELQFLYAKERQNIIAQILPDIAKHGSPPALQAALDAVENADARAILPDIRVPTLLIFGGKDGITPPRMGEYLQKHLPNARLETIAQAAHAPFLSHADEFAQLLCAFVEQV
ncbi:MAG: pimeloyl-ACP methyl ester esterase BioH [Neisseria sp.]|nr:pimeloyl-ACP methyl ester esterase BioH [Neisseria sp.]